MRPTEDEPREMEDWMQTWQQNMEPIDELREDFVRRSRTDALALNVLVAFLCVCVSGLIALAMLRQSPISIVALLLAGPLATYCAVRTRRLAALFRTAPPLTPRGYLEVMRLHLEIKRRQHAFDRSMIPLAVLVPGVIIAMAWYVSGPSLIVVALTLGIGGPGYAYALYESLYKTPERLEAERLRLVELERDLLD